MIHVMSCNVSLRPYERTAEDNDIIYTHLKEFPLLSEQLSNKELKELCTTAHMDIWKDEDYTGELKRAMVSWPGG